MMRVKMMMAAAVLGIGMMGGCAMAAEAAEDAKALTEPIVAADVVFEEVDGLVAVEAEHFAKQTKHDVRAWYITTTQRTPNVEPDGDPSHAATASGGAYVEALPDTRRTHDDKLIVGENFTNEPGRMAVLHYRVHFNTPGRYYVWARIYSTGTEDNGIHVGLNGEWPESGQRLQWTAKDRWYWDSKQRTQTNHQGEPGQIWLDIPAAGEHEITFSMREDGFEFDRWLMTLDAKFERPADAGPATRVKTGTLPAAFAVEEK